MKTNKVLKWVGGIAVFLAIIAGFVSLIMLTIPEELQTPERTTFEASSAGKVTKIKPNGITVKLTNGNALYLKGQSGYTNGQCVLVHVTVGYLRRYKTVPPGVEWYIPTVQPIK